MQRYPMRMRVCLVVAAITTALILSPDLQAQGRRGWKEKREKRQEQQDKKEQRGKPDNKKRASLEQAYRQRAESVVRERLDLNDNQLRRLRDVNARLDTRRRALMREERATRLSLRAEVAKGNNANQGQVAQLMNKAQSLQQQRSSLQDQERRELAKFLSPVQQAKYFGLQARLRQRAKELEEQ